MTARQILVVDDEVGIRELLSEILRDEGYHVKLAENAQQARELRAQIHPELVLLDIWMPDCDGISLLKEWKQAGLLTMPVIMMSGHGTIDTAVEATRIGAFDFLEKPIALQKLFKTVEAALLHAEQSPRTHTPHLSLNRRLLTTALRKRLEQIKPVNKPLLLLGARGSNSELCARFLHHEETPWISLTQRDRLVDSPADLIDQARGGVIYLPEIAGLNTQEQKSLAWIAARAEKNTIRLVCATTHSLPQLLATDMDEMLLQAISAITIKIPMLNEHRDDIPDIAVGMATLFSENGEFEYREFDVGALNLLRQADWIGDFQQLQIVVKTLISTSTSPRITMQEAEQALADFTAQEPAEEKLPLSLDQPLREARDAFERMYFEYHLTRAGNNISRVAETAGLERTHLYRKLKQLGVKP